MIFRHGIFLLFLPSISLLATDVVPLETLEPTAHRWFWTEKGMRELIFNTNLEGNPIRIAGTEYKRAIAGHSLMENVWNLDGKAIRFRALIGMDDESSRLKPVQTDESSIIAQILVDRKLVFSQMLRPNQKAIPVEVDLRGKQQLELRGTYGKGAFVNQNIMWCNPDLTVESETEIRKIAQKWKIAVKSIDSFLPIYPDAPNWKEIKIRKERFGAFPNAYRIITLKQEIVIVPELGGRILHYSVPGGENFLYHDNAGKHIANRMIRGRSGDFAGGHFQRFEPKFYGFPGDPVLKHGCYEIAFPREGEIVMTSQPSPIFFLQYEYRLKITENDVEIQNGIINTAPFAQDISNWPITRVNTSQIRKLDLPDGSSVENGKEFQEKLRNRKAFELQKQSEYSSYKLTMDDGTLFSFSFDPPGENGIHLYFNAVFTEVESHSLMKSLPPGGKSCFSEVWELK